MRRAANLASDRAEPPGERRSPPPDSSCASARAAPAVPSVPWVGGRRSCGRLVGWSLARGPSIGKLARGLSIGQSGGRLGQSRGLAVGWPHSGGWAESPASPEGDAWRGDKGVGLLQGARQLGSSRVLMVAWLPAQSGGTSGEQLKGMPPANGDRNTRRPIAARGSKRGRAVWPGASSSGSGTGDHRRHPQHSPRAWGRFSSNALGTVRCLPRAVLGRLLWRARRERDAATLCATHKHCRPGEIARAGRGTPQEPDKAAQKPVRPTLGQNLSNRRRRKVDAASHLADIAQPSAGTNADALAGTTTHLGSNS